MTHESDRPGEENDDSLDIDYIVSRASVLDLAGRPEEAWEAIKPIVEAGSLNANLGIVMAGLARKVGREPQCLALIDRIRTTRS